MLSLVKLFMWQAHSLPFLVILILSLVMAIVLNFTMFLCTIVNSALTTTIVGVLKGVGSTVSFLCRDYHVTYYRSLCWRNGFLFIIFLLNSLSSLSFSDSWFYLPRWSANTRPQCDWIGHKHSRRCVVFIRQVSAEEENAKEGNIRHGVSQQMRLERTTFSWLWHRLSIWSFIDSSSF